MMAQLDGDTMIKLCKRVQELEERCISLQAGGEVFLDAIRGYRRYIEELCTERDEARRWARKLLTWYEASERRCEIFGEDAYDHFTTSEALKARLAAMVAAGRVDVEV